MAPAMPAVSDTAPAVCAASHAGSWHKQHNSGGAITPHCLLSFFLFKNALQATCLRRPTGSWHMKQNMTPMKMELESAAGGGGGRASEDSESSAEAAQ